MTATTMRAQRNLLESRGEKIAANVVPAVVYTAIGGLYVYGATVCFAAGGGWIVLGVVCGIGVVGCALVVGQSLVNMLS